MSKAATSKRKPATKAKKPPGRPARAKSGSRKPRQRAASAAARAPSPKARARRSKPVSRPVPAAAAYARDDRNAVLLLLAPFAVMTIAVGAIQALAPSDALRRQLALLPEAQPVSETFAGHAALASLSPATMAAPELRLAQVRASPVREAVKAVPETADLATLPPRETLAMAPAPVSRPGKCIATATQPAQSAVPADASPADFGRMLARAARAQTRDLVVYKDGYRQIGFPMGDVPRFYGVCTDVVIRAYRALGIDLQVLVHKARLGTGDPSIDHRRTKTLRRFFERYGESLPITDYVEQYRPGDIVTYYRAGGRTSQTHIAIVADVTAPSGRPMIVHNRGWGPQLEDALFASDITGHYRFSHPSTAEQASAETPAPVASVR